MYVIHLEIGLQPVAAWKVWGEDFKLPFGYGVTAFDQEVPWRCASDRTNRLSDAVTRCIDDNTRKKAVALAGPSILLIRRTGPSTTSGME
jgi:hypothetical protein